MTRRLPAPSRPVGAATGGLSQCCRLLNAAALPSCAALLVLALTGCRRSTSGIPGHVPASMLAGSTRPSARITIRARTRLSPELDTLDQELHRDTITAEVGARESPLDEVFGEVRGASVDRAGTVYVLDSRASEVRVFDRAGRYVGKIGGPGREPGQFVGAQSLAVDVRGSVYVGDLTRRVQVFEADESGLRYSRTLHVAVAPLSMCFIGRHLYVHGAGPHDDYLIHAYDRLGRHIRSFGRAYKLSTSLVNSVLSRGRIACDEIHGLVVYAAASFFGEVQAYDETGKLIWLTAIDGFRPMTLSVERDGFMIAVPATGYHFVRSLVHVPNDGLVYQVGFGTPDSRRLSQPYEHLETYLLQSSSGKGGYAGDSLPQIAAADGSYFVELREVPFWRLRAHSRLWQRGRSGR